MYCIVTLFNDFNIHDILDDLTHLKLHEKKLTQ